ncbi:MAG: flagellar export chaperone FlgN [Thermodesulfobacteriota bacterium]
MDILQRISNSLLRQHQGLLLLYELLCEEHSQMVEKDDSGELATHELSIQELLRQLLKEREEVHFCISTLGAPENQVSDILHLFPEKEQERVSRTLEELNKLEAKCNKQAEINADIAMALVEQSNSLLQFFNKQLWPEQGDVYCKDAKWQHFNSNATILQGRL